MDLLPCKTRCLWGKWVHPSNRRWRVPTTMIQFLVYVEVTMEIKVKENAAAAAMNAEMYP